MYDYWNGIRPGDADSLSSEYDARPIVPGEAGAGSWWCPTCKTLEAGACPADKGTCPEEYSDFCIIGRPCIA
ncbi:MULTISPECIES: hypothetical protein [unclassified Streptomyces]|uniref:hypothetical protein n=1 Tax=unclassified Streptomyces TaxID=2593676 RepID=UPI0022701599|nr:MULTISPECIES: hypothetical protein [unclassified Streptomyces]MCY0924213.1 hypothetical protein [Streptomyces sp. H27-G5]MCY0963247.1 hypothetical protein [Streptomyces sp. H27-H5]